MARRNKKVQRILVLGGARSGKSSYAQWLGEFLSPRRPLYLATAEPIDPEMRERIRQHKAVRRRHWLCSEEPLNVATALANPPPECGAIVLDCVTVWLGNVLHREGAKAAAQRMDDLVLAVARANRPIIIVSNEVGLGIVPSNRMTRQFRDMAGRLNQRLAAVCDSVVLVVAGLHVPLKGRPPLPGLARCPRKRTELNA